MAQDRKRSGEDRKVFQLVSDIYCVTFSQMEENLKLSFIYLKLFTQ